MSEGKSALSHTKEQDMQQQSEQQAGMRRERQRGPGHKPKKPFGKRSPQEELAERQQREQDRRAYLKAAAARNEPVPLPSVLERSFVPGISVPHRFVAADEFLDDQTGQTVRVPGRRVCKDCFAEAIFEDGQLVELSLPLPEDEEGKR